MRIAYLILCHKDPDQINRLVDTLLDGNTDIYIHVDAKFNICNQINARPSLFIIDQRIDTRWGTVSLVHSMLALITAAVRNGQAYDYLNLISGQDYPTQSQASFRNFLRDNYGKEFMEYYTLPNKNLSYEGGIGRVRYRWIDFLTERRSLPFRIVRNIYLHTFGRLFKRTLVDLPVLYGGSNWFTITGHFARYVVDYLESNPAYLKRFNHTGCADEIFFQTLLMNSPFAVNVVNNNLRYVKWTNGSSPDILTASDYDNLVSNGGFFARKVDQIKSADLLEKLDLRNKL